MSTLAGTLSIGGCGLTVFGILTDEYAFTLGGLLLTIIAVVIALRARRGR